MKSNILLLALFFFSLSGYSQTKKTHFTFETFVNNAESSVVYAGNFGELNLNYNTNDLKFVTDLIGFRTGNFKVDSLLGKQEHLLFSFQANLGKGLLGFMNEANDYTYHKVQGTITINNISYPTTALVRIENVLKDVKNISKTVVNLKLQFNPDKVNIPCLSGYFSKSLMFKIKDGVIYENPKSI